MERLIRKHGLPAGVEETYQHDVAEPIVLVSTRHDGAEGGQFRMLTRTTEHVEAFLVNGRVVKLRAYCPLIRRRCKGERCQWYVVRGPTGDCATRWNAEAAMVGLRSGGARRFRPILKPRSKSIMSDIEV